MKLAPQLHEELWVAGPGCTLHPSCVHLLLPLVRMQRGMMYAQLGREQCMNANSATELCWETHTPLELGLIGLELSCASQFVSEPAACTVSSGCP